MGEQIETKRVPIADHPAVLISFIFKEPGILSGVPPTEEFAGRAQYRALMDDIGRRVQRLSGQLSWNYRVDGGFQAIIFGRMLAKIAHAYLVAECGLDTFRPLVVAT